jgi:hypothetical protein
VAGTGNEIALIKVIGSDADTHQILYQLTHDMGAVVDPG